MNKNNKYKFNNKIIKIRDRNFRFTRNKYASA